MSSVCAIVRTVRAVIAGALLAFILIAALTPPGTPTDCWTTTR
jgi:hypothetical protein